MNMRNRIWMAGVLVVLAAPVLAQSAPDRGDRVNERLDQRGERINERLDARGDRIENRLDDRGDRIDGRLDQRASAPPRMETRSGPRDSTVVVIASTIASTVAVHESRTASIVAVTAPRIDWTVAVTGSNDASIDVTEGHA